MATARVTLTVEFEADTQASAELALTRGISELKHSIEHGRPGFGMTGVKAGSVRVTKLDENIET
jgi:hypothetical protein